MGSTSFRGPRNQGSSILGPILPQIPIVVARTYDGGDAREGSQIQANPLVVGERTCRTTPSLQVVALDAVTGKEFWQHDSLEGKRAGFENPGG